MPAVVTILSSGTASSPVGVGLTVEGFTDAPGPRVGLTIGGLDPSSESVVNVWRTADGIRTAVPGIRERAVLAADYVVDYQVPLNRDVFYELELVEGALGPEVTEAGIRIDSDQGWLSDPSFPTASIGIHSRGLPRGEATLGELGLQTGKYEATVSAVRIQGSSLPVVLTSGRQALSDLSMPILVEDVAQGQQLRDLLSRTVVLLLRPLPEWGGDLPGSCFVVVPETVPTALDVHKGGTLYRWDLQGQICASPSARVIVPEVTYGDVQETWTTYQQAQFEHQGGTYLDVQKSPYGGANLMLLSAPEE